MNRRNHLTRAILIAGFLGACLVANGAEWISEDAGVSFQLPNDASWTQIKASRPEAMLVLQRTNATATVFFAAFSKKPNHRDLSEQFIQGWEKGYYRKGRTKKVSGEFFIFQDKRAYKAIDEEMRDGVKVQGVVILWLEDDRLFEIVASKVDADPLKDGVIKQFVDSIKFLPKAAK